MLSHTPEVNSWMESKQFLGEHCQHQQWLGDAGFDVHGAGMGLEFSICLFSTAQRVNNEAKSRREEGMPQSWALFKDHVFCFQSFLAAAQANSLDPKHLLTHSNNS